MKRQKGYVQAYRLQRSGTDSILLLPRTVWKKLVRWQQLYHQRQQLAALSDEMLKDIGVSRADIETESRKPFWMDPECRH